MFTCSRVQNLRIGCQIFLKNPFLSEWDNLNCFKYVKPSNSSVFRRFQSGQSKNVDSHDILIL